MATCKTWMWLILILVWNMCLLPSECAATVRLPPTLSKGLLSAGRPSLLPYQTHFFTQTLDHFSFHPTSPDSTFQQRYLVSTQHWIQGSGPIFLYCGNEGNIEWFAQNTGLLWELAPQFGALLLFPEHRYYGESMPFGSREAAYKDANSLAYLTSEQALADFVTLLRDFKYNFSAEACPVVLFGGSYGGMLAAWMRLKYPHTALGAIASSAPILQFEDLTPDDTYYRLVSESFKRESTTCFGAIRESWDILQATGEMDGGLEYLSSKFQLCRQLSSTTELVDWIISAYSYLAMVNYPYPAEFIISLPAFPIKEVCNAINSNEESTDILSRIFAGISVFYNYTGSASCFDITNDPHGMDGWNWQACTEMVMPMSSNRNNSMFPPWSFDVDEFSSGCLKEFGVRPRPLWITTEFGFQVLSSSKFMIFCSVKNHESEHELKKSEKNLNMNKELRNILLADVPLSKFWSSLCLQNITHVLENFGSNIVFSNGLLDPWSGGGVLHNISETIVATVTEKGAHHLDLRFSSESDPQWLIEQRQFEVDNIKRWLLHYDSQQNLNELWDSLPFKALLSSSA